MYRTSLLVAIVIAVLGMSHSVHAQCAAWAPLTNVSHDTGHYAVDGNLAVDSAGNVHLVYQSFLDSWGAAYYVTNAGGSWSSPQSLGSLGGKGSAPKIVITPDNMLHAFYGKNNLYWRTKPVSGGSWSTAVQVDANPGGGSFIQQVTVDASGGIYFMYGHLFDSSAPARNGIYGRYKPLGGAWGTTELVYGNNDDGNWPRGDDIAARGDTLWVSIGVDGHIYYKKKPSTGAWPAGKGTRLVSNAGGMRFAFSPVSGEIAALYTQALSCTDPCEDDPWFEVFVKYSYDDGASWTAPQNISGNVNDIDRTPSGTYDANGNLHVVWEGFCCDHKARMRYRGRINGVWDSGITLITSNVGGHIPNSIRSFGSTLFVTFSNSGSGIGLYDVMFTSAVPAQPRIGVSPASLSQSIALGAEAAAQVLQINNPCFGTLDYTVTPDAPWLSVAPPAGSCTTETDSIIVSYPGTPSLPLGTHNATITITSGNAMNSPQTVPVRITIVPVRTDFDDDGDVDLEDFALFQICFNGPNRPPALPTTCGESDVDGDADVDLSDFAAFQACFNGPNRRPTCSY